MSSGQERLKYERKLVPPQKKVTFYGPVVSTRGEKLRPVNLDTISKRQKQMLHPSSNSSLFNQTSQIHRKSKHIYNKSKSTEVVRPHTKISVTGSQLKTRLNCNHARPKCNCPTDTADTLKQIKAKYKPLIKDIGESNHILTSTCTAPRGGANGRKIYGAETGKDVLSVVDTNWRPSQFISKENDLQESGNRQKISYHSHSENEKSKQTSEVNSKKRVQFFEKTTPIIEHDKQSASDDSPRKPDKYTDNNAQSFDIHQPPYMTGKTDRSVLPERSYSYRSEKNDSQYKENFHEKYDSSSSVSASNDFVNEIPQETCKLCETPTYTHQSRSKLKTTNSSSDFFQSGSKKSWNTCSASPLRSYGDDICSLCKRFNQRSHSLDDRHCYHCESSDLDSSDILPCPCNLRIQNEYLSKNISPKISNAFTSNREETLQKEHIPYEPKTELVKDLKKKLEREYRHQDYLHHLMHHRRWKSWDAEHLDELRRYRSQRVNRYRDLDYGPPHKCVHHYLQNDRLYLEPTITNVAGNSLCSECGAPQPSDAKEDPFLYHITLGGLEKNKVKSALPSDKENDRRYYHQSERVSHVQKAPGDTSKHVFAKLNHSIDNIFPVRSNLHLRPRAADHLRYQVPSHTKRHPNKSMALIDHLV